MPTPSWTVSFTMPTASNSPAKACAGHEANRTRRLDQPPSPMTQIHRPARLATRAASFRYGGRHHSGIPGDIIPFYPGDFVGIRRARPENLIAGTARPFFEAPQAQGLRLGPQRIEMPTHLQMARSVNSTLSCREAESRYRGSITWLRESRVRSLLVRVSYASRGSISTCTHKRHLAHSE